MGEWGREGVSGGGGEGGGEGGGGGGGGGGGEGGSKISRRELKHFDEMIMIFISVRPTRLVGLYGASDMH